MQFPKGISAALFLFVAAIFTLGATNQARAYDIDCKLILCLAGGFPSGCADAKSYMFDRITDTPPKPPIGFCAMSNGAEYSAFDLDYSFLRATQSEAWVCPEGQNRFFDSYDNDGDTEIKVFCYDERNRIGFWGSDDDARYSYTNVTVPEFADFRIQITVEPGTAAEYTNGVQQFESGIRGIGFRTNVSYRP